MRAYTFVTVAHEADAGQLFLQARSMALYAPDTMVAQIFVVENWDHEAVAWRDALRAAYGRLAYKVRFVAATDLVPQMPKVAGWWSQQVLKLEIARHVWTDRYVVLDAKTFLTSPLTRSFLETPAGLPRLNGYGYDKHPLRSKLLGVLQFMGVAPAALGPSLEFPRTSPPFTFITEEVWEMIADIQRAAGKPFAEVFCAARLTEFFAYSAWLMKRGALQDAYDWTAPHSPQLWKHDSDPVYACKVIAATRGNACPFLSVHRGALEVYAAQPDQRVSCALAIMLVSVGLFKTAADARAFIANPNASIKSDLKVLPAAEDGAASGS